jgi:multiple sugar transport system permease protein
VAVDQRTVTRAIRPRASSWGRARRRDAGTALLFLLPLFVLVGGLIFYPFYRAIWLSLTDKLVGYPERFVGLRNYIYLAQEDTFHQVIRNSLVFTVGSVALKIVTGLAMALVLNNVIRGRNFFRGLFLLPWITSTVIIALTWRWMFDAFPGRGFFNSVLLDAGLISRPIAFMATPEGAMAAVIVANWWRAFPFFGVSFLAGMASIPKEHYEAAAVDGAGATAPLLAHHPARAQARHHRHDAAQLHPDHQRLQYRLRDDPRRAGHGHADLRHVLLRSRVQPAPLGARGDDLDLPRAAPRGRHRLDQPLPAPGAAVRCARSRS